MAVEIDINEVVNTANNLDIGFPLLKPIDISNVGLNALGRDALGRPFFMDLVLSSEKMGETWRLPFEPLVRLSKRKHLVETKIAGTGENEGVVIEQISKGYYAIQIRGVLQNENFQDKSYPTEQVEALERFMNSSEPMDVECDLLELFKIRKLVIKNFEIDDMKGKPYSQAYIFNAISYNDFYAKMTLQ